LRAESKSKRKKGRIAESKDRKKEGGSKGKTPRLPGVISVG
jgi:hypothetical protein